MKRRDFLFLRTHRGVRTVEVSCLRLHSQWLETRSTARLFEDLEHDLRGADVLRVVERERLSGASDELRIGFGNVISAFRSRGGQVEFSQSERGER